VSEGHHSLTTKTDIIRNIDEGFYKVNKDQSGFYRTSYPPERLIKLRQSQDLLTTEDKIGLIGDAAALAVSGEGTTAALLALIEGFQNEKDYLVWSQLASSLGNLRSIFAEDKPVAAGLKKFGLTLVTSAAEEIGWEFKEGEDYLTGQLRRLLISIAGHAGHTGITAEAKRRFSLWNSGQDKTAIHHNLRSAVFTINIAEGGQTDYDSVKEEYLHTDSVDGREICLLSLGRTKSLDLVKDFIDFLFSDKVATQDLHGGAMALAANSKARAFFWEYIKANWDSIEQKTIKNKVVLQRFVRLALSKFADHAIEQDIVTFYQDKDTSGFDRALVIVSDTIRSNANYKKRDEERLLEWFQMRGYA